MSNCRYFFFYCYGDHRDLHVRTRSFPTRRSSDLSARTTRHITAVQKTAVCCTPPAAAAKLAFYAVELSNNPCEKQRSENPYRRLNVEHSRSEEHTSELQSIMRISYAVLCLKKKKISPK